MHVKGMEREEGVSQEMMSGFFFLLSFRLLEGKVDSFTVSSFGQVAFGKFCLNLSATVKGDINHGQV